MKFYFKHDFVLGLHAFGLKIYSRRGTHFSFSSDMGNKGDRSWRVSAIVESRDHVQLWHFTEKDTKAER